MGMGMGTTPHLDASAHARYRIEDGWTPEPVGALLKADKFLTKVNVERSAHNPVTIPIETDRHLA